MSGGAAMIDLKGKVILVLEAVDEHHDVVLDALPLAHQAGAGHGAICDPAPGFALESGFLLIRQGVESGHGRG